MTGEQKPQLTDDDVVEDEVLEDAPQSDRDRPPRRWSQRLTMFAVA